MAIIGIGLHPFGRFDGLTAMDMGVHAARQALQDSGIEWPRLDFAYGGSLSVANPDTPAAFPDTMVGRLGLTGLPFVNVMNGCATAGSALLMALQTIRSGLGEVGLVVGFDKHPRGAFDPDPGIVGHRPWYGDVGMMLTTQFFAMKATRYMHDHGISESTLAKVAAKNFRNGAKNPNAWRQKAWDEEEILASRMLNRPLRQYMFCSPDEGGAALVVCKADLARQFTSTPVFVDAVSLRTRRFGSFEVFSSWLPLDESDSPTVDASRAAYEMAGIGPEDVRVVQVQDSEAGHEIMHMAENGFCEHGEQEHLIQAGETEIGGRLPVNTDGGLIANGEPIGASGLRQIYEVCLQLRGQAGARQVPNDPKVGYTQVYGAPGIGCCTVLSV
jgi:acetyl-CoA acetyltransferase